MNQSQSIGFSLEKEEARARASRRVMRSEAALGLLKVVSASNEGCMVFQPDFGETFLPFGADLAPAIYGRLRANGNKRHSGGLAMPRTGREESKWDGVSSGVSTYTAGELEGARSSGMVAGDVAFRMEEQSVRRLVWLYVEPWHVRGDIDLAVSLMRSAEDLEGRTVDIERSVPDYASLAAHEDLLRWRSLLPSWADSPYEWALAGLRDSAPVVVVWPDPVSGVSEGCVTTYGALTDSFDGIPKVAIPDAVWRPLTDSNQ